jgi:ABC-type lipoprotein release transport system permease subunit
MQRKSVRNLFLLEAIYLATGGTVVGWALAALVMFVLSLFGFGTTSVLSLFLNNGHFTFSPQFGSMLGQFALVLVLTTVAAFLPARKASLLPPAEALRTSK